MIRWCVFKKIILLFSLLLSLIFPKDILAISDPLAVPNNKFGIHIHDENDLSDSKNLINSNNGDWGYVTFVITEKDRDRDRWQKVFDQMRRDHIIPIVRIATKPIGNVWERPNVEEINNWAGFLNSLNWVIENRYVVILNEPNLNNEWQGKSNAKEYANYLKNISIKLKETSPDFFILPAGLAPEKNEFKYIDEMLKEVPDVFNYIDGWTSHPYPTTSITLYEKELTYIKKDLPIFITETGWSGKDFSEDEITDRLMNSYGHIWTNKKIVAITPFILNYPSYPFAQFSWKKEDGSFYKFYDEVVKIPKIKGEPRQINKGEILAAVIQPAIPTGTDFVGAILAKNTGQVVWSQNNTLVGFESERVKAKNIYMSDIEPMRFGLIYLKSNSPESIGTYKDSLFLTNAKGEKISEKTNVESFMFSLGQINLWSIIDGVRGKFGL